MAVEQDPTRKAVPITWDNSLTFGDTVSIRCTNPDNEDVSVAEGKNDGKQVVTYPAEYEGQSLIVVTGSEGGEDDGYIQA